MCPMDQASLPCTKHPWKSLHLLFLQPLAQVGTYFLHILIQLLVGIHLTHQVLQLLLG